MTDDETRNYLAMLDALDEAVQVVDRDFRVLFQNRSLRDWQRDLGIDGDAVGRVVFDAYPFLSGRVRDEYREVFETGRVLVTRERSLLGGREILTETRKIPIFNGSEVAKVVTCMRDLSDQARMEAQLRESEEKYRALVESTDNSIYLVDRDCRYLFMNRKHIARMGLAGSEFLGRAYDDFHGPEETRWFREKVAEVFATGAPARHEHRSARDGTHFLLTLSPVRHGGGGISAISVVSKDVTQLKKLEEELRALALTDGLTGLYNRRGFVTLAEYQLRLADRRREGVYMLYADLDGLKRVNDTFGHHEGDRALVETAGLLKSTYRTSDVISRIGGDEFAVIPVGTGKDHVEAIVRRFEESLAAFNAQGRLGYPLSVSVGVFLYDPAQPLPLEELIARADAGMYERKRLRDLPPR